MDCLNVRCLDQGYCDCHQEKTAEATGGCLEILILMVVGVFAAFLYPAIRIFRSNIKYNHDYEPQFSGAVWLFTSPLFGFLAQMLYQFLFMLAAGAVTTTTGSPPKIIISIFKVGMFVIYALAIGLAVAAFLIKNRAAIKLFVTAASSRTVRKTAILIGLLFMASLTVFAAAGIVVFGAEGYFNVQSDIQNTGGREQKTIFDEKVKFDSYVGKYKFTTRSDKELFVVSKSGNGENLRLNMKDEKAEGRNNDGCLLTPKIEENSIYYAVSECVVDGRQSPLGKIYFRVEGNKTKMYFVYNVRANGDTLEKIK